MLMKSPHTAARPRRLPQIPPRSARLVRPLICRRYACRAPYVSIERALKSGVHAEVAWCEREAGGRWRGSARAACARKCPDRQR